MTRACGRTGCTQPVIYRDGRWFTYCGRRCTIRAKIDTTAAVQTHTSSRTSDRLTEVQMMLDAREHPEQIAARLGISRPALTRWLRRTGHAELAERLWIVTS